MFSDVSHPGHALSVTKMEARGSEFVREMGFNQNEELKAPTSFGREPPLVFWERTASDESIHGLPKRETDMARNVLLYGVKRLKRGDMKTPVDETADGHCRRLVLDGAVWTFDSFASQPESPQTPDDNGPGSALKQSEASLASNPCSTDNQQPAKRAEKRALPTRAGTRRSKRQRARPASESGRSTSLCSDSDCSVCHGKKKKLPKKKVVKKWKPCC